ncbi:cupin domain-containing protein [Microbacterium sp. H1-D42]|uniref:cupin domain-containing protein n=1 Tax=Microbacterium sp. H1-D42 TaxID=2925844 RepID=UPI001F535AAB|nr:cupin domain-containing protein [Microbacterium sp. H1-D42]UNK71373.1 cupin domain-containing protein [Microbacterium sp. H1-D42]
MSGLPLEAAGAVSDAGELTVVHELLPANDVIDGTPTAGVHELGTFAGVELGVWEMSPGVATDTEADEVFIVLSGRARIDFTMPALPSIEVSPGSVVRLTQGMRTTWTVTETLRKVYLVEA